MRVVEATLVLDRPRLLDALAHLRRGDAAVYGPHFLVRHRGYFDLQVNPVEQRPTDLAQVPLNLRWCASAFTRGIAEEATPARVKRTNQNKAGRERQRHVTARQGYRAVRSEEHTSELQSRQYLVCRL